MAIQNVVSGRAWDAGAADAQQAAAALAAAQQLTMRTTFAMPRSTAGMSTSQKEL